MVTLLIIALVAAGLVLVPYSTVLGICILFAARMVWQYHSAKDEANFMALLGVLAFLGAVGLTATEIIRRWL